MQHDPEESLPTTQNEAADVEAQALTDKENAGSEDDVQAHTWKVKPPIVDDAQDAG